MERRVFLAILLSFVVLYAYQALLVPPPQRDAPQSSAGAAAPVEAPAPARPEAAAAAPVEAAPPPPDIAATTSESAEREIVVETARVVATMSNRGGRILSWRLKEYQNDEGQPIDLIPSGLPADQPKPFSLQVDDEALTRRLNGALYRASGDVEGRVDATQAAASLVFEYQDASGLDARKEFRFSPDDYVVTFVPRVRQGDRVLNPSLAWGPGLDDMGALSGGGSFFTGNYVQPPQGIYHNGDDVERLTGADVAEQPIHEANFRFAGIDDHYFIATVVNPGRARIEFRSLTLPEADGLQRQLVAPTLHFPEPPEEVRVYAGPKQFDVLQSVDGELVRSINFGIFGWLAVPLLGALKWIYGYVGNYGWAIILLTILINIVLFPLRHKSVVSMRKMQVLQPQLKAIQDRYAGLKVTDPARQKMNTEVMNLYREKGVNPASGCVPMLLTMPVLLAFYSLLSQSIELRGAEFGWWISDLSRHDPLYVTPLLMGASMFWQQKIAPTSMDPAQQRIMMIMPVMFTVMFLWVPSGLVIYWFTSNLWTIGQQYFTYWLIGPPPVAAVRPPAERRIKSAGSGRSAGAEKRPSS